MLRLLVVLSLLVQLLLDELLLELQLLDDERELEVLELNVLDDGLEHDDNVEDVLKVLLDTELSEEQLLDELELFVERLELELLL